ncbi:23350_t:CDS:10, partial [Racocetra persica]
EDKIYEAEIAEEHVKKILNTIDNDKFLIRIKFIRPDYDNFKIVDKYEPIRELKKVVRAIQIKTSDFEILKNNAVVYGLRIIEHFEKAKRGHGLTSIRKQKIDTWEKRMCQPDARVEDVAELEKILKRPIKLLDITHGTIFNNRIVEYYNDNAWNTINKALQDPQGNMAYWTRTWRRQNTRRNPISIADAVDWQLQEGIISEEKEQEFLESLKNTSIHKNIKQSCVEYRYRGRWNTPNYQVKEVVCIDIKEYYPASMYGQGECLPWFKLFGHPTHHLVRVAVNGKLPQDDITRFVQIRSFKFVLYIHPAIPVWYGKHFACQSGEECGKVKGWTPIVLLRYLLEADILKSVTIGEAIISLTKQKNVEEKCLTYRVVIDEGELDFLIQDCIKEGTYAASMLAYAHINLLEMFRRFGPNEVQVKQKISYPKDSVNTKSVKVFQKTKMPLAVGEYFSYSKHKPFVCHDCFWDWYVYKGFWEVIPDKKPSSNTKIQSRQWRDNGEKIYGPDPNVVYWAKNRHWESIKDIIESTASSIHDPITRSRVFYLNGGGGSEKTTCAIRIFKDINMVVFTHTNVLAKDFQNDHKVKAQTWHSFFRWNGIGE